MMSHYDGELRERDILVYTRGIGEALKRNFKGLCMKEKQSFIGVHSK